MYLGMVLLVKLTSVALALKEGIWVGVGEFDKVGDWHERRNLVG